MSGPSKLTNGVLAWGLKGIEPNTIEQAGMTQRLPFVKGHVALMPDAHVGMGSTVGSVIPTEGAIIPAAIGVDIGCGMIAAQTWLTADDLPDSLDGLMPLIERRIPAGVGKGFTGNADDLTAKWFIDHALDMPEQVRASDKLFTSACQQFGTLGSGNHFVEVCLDENDTVWIVLHSGSRGVGNKIAKRHIDGATKLMQRYFIDLEDRDLSYLVQGTEEFKTYIGAMLWAQDYALGSRECMMDAAILSLGEVAEWTDKIVERERINCHHNFTQMEHHHGRNMWITRKGAIKADVGDMGVIPGSMGTASYIVSGLGNAASYKSCSHGAGRRMSRGEARRNLTAESLTAAMGDRTWNAGRASSLVDEHPEAYKDIDKVMEAQSDLVQVEHTLRQVFNYKG